MKAKHNISEKMIKRASTVLLLAIGLIITACDKEEVMPEKNAGYDKEYVLPQARILNQQERDLIRARREEYNRVLNE